MARKNDAAREVYSLDQRWWLADEGDVHGRVWSTLGSIQGDQQWRRTQMEHHARLYSDRPSHAMGSSLYARIDPTPGTRLSINVCRNMVDSVVAKITKSRPKPTFLTDGGTFDLTRSVTYEGVLTKVELVNPHSWLYVNVKNADGTETLWSFEGSAPPALVARERPMMRIVWIVRAPVLSATSRMERSWIMAYLP